MARELSGVLDHIARIAELDLERRAAHLARRGGHRPAAPRRAAALAAARGRARAGARCRRRRLPRPEPPGVSGIRRTDDGDTDVALTAAQAPCGRSRPGDLSAPTELFDAYRGARGRGRAELLHRGSLDDRARSLREPNCRRGIAASALGGACWPRRCAACRSPSRTSSAPRACPASPARASSRATARPTPRPPSRAWPLPARRCWARPTRTSSRWAPPTRTPPSAPS